MDRKHSHRGAQAAAGTRTGTGPDPLRSTATSRRHLRAAGVGMEVADGLAIGWRRVTS